MKLPDDTLIANEKLTQYLNRTEWEKFASVYNLDDGNRNGQYKIHYHVS